MLLVEIKYIQNNSNTEIRKKLKYTRQLQTHQPTKLHQQNDRHDGSEMNEK